MKYKVGDKIRLKGTDSAGTVIDIIIRGQLLIILSDGSKIVEWPENVVLIEGLAEEETKPEPKFKVGDSVEVLKSGNTYTISQMKFNGKEFVYTLSNNGSTVSCFSEEEIEFTEEDKYWCDIMSESDPTTYVLPQGYQFVDENGDVINATKIVLEKKKKEYPKTYEECLSVLGIYNGLPDVEIYNAKPSECELFEAFIRLKRCRDAYWKIYGEKMGLDKPWEPDWRDYITKYCIIYSPQYRGICKRQYDDIKHILAFPTEEMRDSFKENFNPDIEICKEFL